MLPVRYHRLHHSFCVYVYAFTFCVAYVWFVWFALRHINGAFMPFAAFADFRALLWVLPFASPLRASALLRFLFRVMIFCCAGFSRGCVRRFLPPFVPQSVAHAAVSFMPAFSFFAGFSRCLLRSCSAHRLKRLNSAARYVIFISSNLVASMDFDIALRSRTFIFHMLHQILTLLPLHAPLTVLTACI